MIIIIVKAVMQRTAKEDGLGPCTRVMLRKGMDMYAEGNDRENKAGR